MKNKQRYSWRKLIKVSRRSFSKNPPEKTEILPKVGRNFMVCESNTFTQYFMTRSIQLSTIARRLIAPDVEFEMVRTDIWYLCQKFIRRTRKTKSDFNAKRG